MASNAEQKNQARQKREAAQAAAAAQNRRNRMVQGLAGTVFLAVVVVLVIVFVSGGDKSKGPAGIGDDDSSQVAGVSETNKLLAGIPQSGFTLGQPKAPVTIVEFLDVQCPFCRDHELDRQPTVIRELVRTGKAKLRAAPIALPQMGQDSEDGRIVAAKVSDDGKAWNFLNLFYFNQGDEATGYVTDDFLKKLVAASGAPAGDADRTGNAETEAKLAEVDKLRTDLDVTGTPTFFIGRTGQEPSSYEKVEASGTASVVDQLISKTNELSKKAGV